MSAQSVPNGDAVLLQTDPQQEVTPELVLQVLNNVRAALADLLFSAGVDPTKTRETARQLDLSRGLIWRVSTVIASTDMAVVAQKIPTKESVESLCRACAQHGASAKSLDQTRTTVQLFENTVKRFSGDRKSLTMILSSTVSDDITDQQEQSRKLAYQANSTIWGIQAEVQLRSCFLAPGQKDGLETLDYVSVASLIGVRRLRSISWPIFTAGYRNDEGEEIVSSPEPIDKTSTEPGEAPLMQEFCSSPMPKIRTLPLKFENVFELAEGPIGNAGLSTIVVGTITRNSQSYFRQEDDVIHNFLTYMHTPVKRIIMDLFLHRDLEIPSPPEAMLIDRMVHPHGAGISTEEAERRRMPMSTTPRELGLGSASSVTPHIPWYPKMVEDVCQRCDWSANDFRGYRLEMAYPPNPTALVLGLKKPERPV